MHTSSVQPLLLTHTIKVNSDLMWNAFVHGHCIMKNECSSLKNFPDKLTPAALNDLMAVLEKYSVCPGHPDKHFVEMAQCKKGKLKSSDGKTVVATVDLKLVKD